MEDETIIKQRIASKSVRAIARAHGVSVTAINETIDRWAASSIDDNTRKNTLALELARLDDLQETFYRRALDGDVQCGALVTKIIERRAVMLQLHVPQTAVLQIIDAATAKPTSTERIQAALDALCAESAARSGRGLGALTHLVTTRVCASAKECEPH